jgi:hypothetical protein
MKMPPLDPPMQSSAHKFYFHLAKAFPPDDPLSVPLLRLMMAANDVRHIQKLLLLADARTDHASTFDREILNGELLHLHRLLCGHLYEAGSAFRAIDAPHPELANAAVHDTENIESLQRLRAAYASDPPGAFHHTFLYGVRNQFGFHYKPEDIQAKLRDFSHGGNLDGVVIAAEDSGFSRYVVADHLMIGMLQDLLNATLPDFHAAFGKAIEEVLSIAGDLGDVVDLMLLRLLEKDASTIIRRESGAVQLEGGPR